MSKKPVRVIYDGGLTDREHAIIEAHRWQLAHASERPSEAYTVIVHLLMLLPYAEVQAAIAKSTATVVPSPEEPQ